ncbi:substrate-binding domain-containing protein [Microbacterium sp. A196]|uniref:substrate-binding domain-containing protein n=1 Tax=unclassified Microbacterium TaxID=2609290 RepID=UPI003FD25BDB
MITHSITGQRFRRTSLCALTVVLAGSALVACSADNGNAAGGEDTVNAVSTAQLAASGCGSLTGPLPNDPDGLLAGYPEDIQAAFQGVGMDLGKSAWADLPESEGPWKIGLTMLPLATAINQAYHDQLQKRFDEAKEQGLVEGDLVVNLMSEFNPAQQLQTYQQLVGAGVDGILIQPMSGQTMASAVDAAGEDGIVTASFATLPSTYAVTAHDNFFHDAGAAAAATLGQLPDGTGKVLIVNGIEGVDPQVQGREGVDAALEACPDIEVVGEVAAAFNDPSAKEGVQTFLASYPGEIDAVLQLGGMATGSIAAFQQVGREVPLVSMNGATAGALSYWIDNKDTYSAAGVVGDPVQQADAVWDTLMRTLAGASPKSNYISLPPVLINNDNLAEIAEPGGDYSSEALAGTGVPYFTDEILDQYFAKDINPLK